MYHSGKNENNNDFCVFEYIPLAVFVSIASSQTCEKMKK